MFCSSGGSDELTATSQDHIVYLDHAATTPMRAEAVTAMLPFLSDLYGNPSGAHQFARTALRALDAAREEIALLLGAHPGEIVFTSGGTESDNLAVLGVGDGAGTVLCSAVEHPGVLRPTSATGGRTVAVDARGVIDLDVLAGMLNDKVRLVSVMLVNNETGVRQPLDEVVALVHQRAPRALVHTDAVQAFGWFDIASVSAGADLVSLSAHKFGGPKGVGALVVRGRASALRPVLLGGSQEHERRAGTQNVAGIVAMAAAASCVARDRKGDAARVAELSRRLVDGIIEAAPGVHEAVPRVARIDAICNLGIEGVASEELLMVLDNMGVCVSAGSSCASGAIEPSHVLLAMGLDARRAKCHVRLSLGHTTSDADIDRVLTVFPQAVARLRA